MFLKKMLRAILATFEPKRPGIYMGHARTCDISFGYRMGAGFPGDVNRTHPVNIEPCLVDPSAPPTLYGQAVVIDATSQGVRPLVAGDSSLTAIYGITVRPFPIQGQSSTNYGASNIGAATPPTSQPMDVVRSGYIMSTLSGSTAAVKGGTVYVWVAASSGSHIQGNFEAAATGGSTIALDAKTSFNGPADASGVVEVAFNI
ncbi:hypothetical protein [Paraburkholderia sp. BCC1885]|uniref:structural cement protein Gp24 n=1 Tax=Paraburkholderia sp. BCC1885 TaxID=2562669 RepID=UPI0011840D91|nr:hypothetical protein [Paraburkholderia sp. BCC1885]